MAIGLTKLRCIIYQYYNENEWKDQFRVARLGIQLRYSYKEDYVQLGSFNLQARSRFPYILPSLYARDKRTTRRRLCLS